MKATSTNKAVLLLGEGRMLWSLSVCLLQAGHPVVLHTSDSQQAFTAVRDHWEDLLFRGETFEPSPGLELRSQLNGPQPYELAIIVTAEDPAAKKNFIRILEAAVGKDTIIAVNTEGIPLHHLQEGCRHPQRIIGVNWAEPVHTTSFMEVIANGACDQGLVDTLLLQARTFWKKDVYKISGEYGIRGRMFTAMAREAFYLVQNGYASFEDIDRAFRNDAGYYLPFAGSLRYMDLMGAPIYGIVMKDLFPELSKETVLPPGFTEIITAGALGMENGRGFFIYGEGEAEKWAQLCRKFSYEIRDIMHKYTFPFREETRIDEPKPTSAYGPDNHR